MPALTTNTAVIAHSQVDMDGVIGPQTDETGTIYLNASFKPSRTQLKKRNAQGANVGWLFNNPELMVSFGYETTIGAAVIPSAGPATALTLAEFANFDATTCKGWSTSEGFFSVLSNTQDGTPGDFYKGSIELQLLQLPVPGTLVVRAA